MRSYANAAFLSLQPAHARDSSTAPAARLNVPEAIFSASS